MDLDTILELLQKDLAREMGHMMFYLRNSATLTGLHRQEIRELFLEEASSEMKHVQQFQDLIIGLGGNFVIIDPTLSPLFTDPQEAVKYAYEMETEVVANYVERLEQAQQLGGVNGRVIEIFLEEQILHSRTDADNLRMLRS